MENVIGLITVIWLAAKRFNTPRPVRTYTKAAAYFWGCAAYVAGAVLLYALAYSVLGRTAVAEAYAALGAVVFTGLVVLAPGASRLDRWVREGLHRAIGYPGEAHRLAAALAVVRFDPDPRVRNEVKILLQARGYDVDDDWLPVAEPVRELWFRAAALFQQVRGWERDARFGDFVWLAHDEFDVLRQRFDQLSLKVVRVLETIEQLGRLFVCADGDAATKGAGGAQQRIGADLRSIISRLLADLRQDLAFFNHNLCLFVARAALTECASARGRHRQLAGLGFRLASEPPSTAKVLGLTFVFYFAAFVAFMTPLLTGTVADPGAMLSKIALIALIQVLAVTVAVVPKPLFGFANENLRGETPWSFVLGAGVAAALLAVPLLFAFHWLLGARPNGCVAIGGFRVVLAWLAMPFATASVLAFLIQDGRWARIDSPVGRRLADVAVMVVALGLAVGAARGLQYLAAGCEWDHPERDAWLMGVIAVGVGYMIPRTFRRRLPGGSPAAGGSASLARPAPGRATVGART